MKTLKMMFPLTIFVFVSAVSCVNLQRRDKSNKVLFFEDFSNGMENWWVEGGQRVWVQDGRLHVKANIERHKKGYVCTVWCKKQFGGDIQIDFDAHIIQPWRDSNCINFFLCYSDPSGKGLYQTRQTRASALYKLYHKLNGYIFTFVKDANLDGGTYPDGSAKARFRIRRNPGFQLLAENYDYHCRKAKTYHITITKLGQNLEIAVDGKVYLTARDDKPWESGLIGLRTFCTYLWWDNIRVVEIKP